MAPIGAMSFIDFLGRMTYTSQNGVRDLPFYRSRIAVLRFINYVQKLAYTAVYRSPFKGHVLPRYRYQMTPAQLHCLCTFVEKTAAVPGRAVEIGCAEGRTSIFLYHFMKEIGLSREYVALDTFCGFTAADIDWEVTKRDKRKGMYIAFRNNSHARFRSMLRVNGAEDLKSVETDANRFDMRRFAPVAFALIDIDLYRPTKKILSELYDALSPGGVMIVDDCNKDNFFWDGAYQAYSEFVTERALTESILFDKLGIIEKPQSVRTDASDAVTGGSGSSRRRVPIAPSPSP